MTKPGSYILEIRTSWGDLIRDEHFRLFSQLLQAARKQPPNRRLYAYNDNHHDGLWNGLTEEEDDLFQEALLARKT